VQNAKVNNIIKFYKLEADQQGSDPEIPGLIVGLIVKNLILLAYCLYYTGCYTTIFFRDRDPGIPGLGKHNPEIPGLKKPSGIAIPNYMLVLWDHISLLNV
jgi:hypothetical protein